MGRGLQAVDLLDFGRGSVDRLDAHILLRIGFASNEDYGPKGYYGEPIMTG